MARLAVVTTAQAAVGLSALALILVTDEVGMPRTVPFVLFTAVLIGLTLLPPVYVELRRHGGWVTLADGASVVGLFLLGPVGLLAAIALSEVVVLARVRQAPLKRLVNLVTMLAGAAVGIGLFAAIGVHDPSRPEAWSAAFATLVVIATYDLVLGTAVIAIAERERWRDMLTSLAPALVVSLVVASALGFVSLILLLVQPWSLVLLLPLLTLLHASTRALTQQQSERQRFAALYEASARMGELVALDRMLQTVAEEARTLTTGAASMAFLVDVEGASSGVVVDDGGARRLEARTIASFVDELDVVEADTLVAVELPGALIAELPPSLSVVRAARAVQDATLLILVAREFAPDGNDDHRQEVLVAFATHAATMVANVRMHDDVQRALRKEQALNQQKTDFVAAVSHELRTPLASMAGVLQTMRRHRGRLPDDYEQQLLGAGLEQAARLRRLIDDLLVVAATDHRTIEVAHEPLDLGAFVAELEGEFASRLGGRLEVHLASRARGRRLATDEGKLRQVVVNLLENARKYAPHGPVELHLDVLENRCVVSVRDHGPGVRAEDRVRIFERFVQLDQSSTRREGGTGLGLHLARELASLLGGRLWVEDAPGGGARFVVELPIGPAPAEAGRSDDATHEVAVPGEAVAGRTGGALSGQHQYGIRSNPLRAPTTEEGGASVAPPGTAGAAPDGAARPRPAVVSSAPLGGARHD